VFGHGAIVVGTGRARVRAASAFAFAFAACAGNVAAAAQTPAGTPIRNVAAASWTPEGGAPLSQPSNTDTLTIAERLDVALSPSPVGAVSPDAGSGVVPVLLTNAGNGNEAFAIDAALASTDLTVRSIAADSDGDGQYDPARDLPLTDARTPDVAAEGTLLLFVVLDGNAAAEMQLTVAARAVTGSGDPGLLVAGQGDGGSDAVVGPTGAQAKIALAVAPATAPSLVKSQAVLAPDGSSQTVRGAIVTYTLEARFPGPTTAARIDDPLPAGTIFIAGSLSVDGAPLTDASDGDGGSFEGGKISIALGDIAAAATRTVQFQAKLQ